MLGNPCLMSPHRCASVGRQFTCQYKVDQGGLYCENVCGPGFCGGGDCHADHNPNNGHDGKAKCR